MIIDPMNFRNNYRKILHKNDYAIVTRFNDPSMICLRFDENLKNMQGFLRDAHRAAREHINES